MNKVVKITKENEYGEVISMAVEPMDSNCINLALEDMYIEDMDLGETIVIKALELSDEDLGDLELECF